MKTILITAIGSFAAGAVMENCREYGYRVIGTDIYPKEWLAEGSAADRFYQVPRADSGEDYLSAVRKIIREEGVSAVIPLTDAEIDVLNGCRKMLEPAVLSLSPEDSVRVFRDKEKSAGIAEEILRHTGSSLTVRTIPSRPAAGADPATLSFPQILKPLNGRSSEGLYRLRNREEFALALACISGGKSGLSDYILQPLVRGNVITVDIVRDGEGNCVAIPREELLRTLNGAGLSVRMFRDRELEKVCLRLAEGMNVLGCVNMEFIREENTGVLWFLECNPHFSGGTAFSCRYGYNTVENHLRALEGKKIRTDVPDAECWLVKKYMEVRTK